MECCKIENKCLINALIVTVLIFLIALFFSKVIDIRDKIQATENTITVSGTGTIYTKPDLVLATFSVVTEAKTVSEALKENTEKMNAIIDFAKNQGIEDKDLKTISFNIYPRYEYESEEVTCALSSYYPCPPGKQVLVGYEVYQSLEVKIRDMTKIGDIIQGATDAGANEVGDLQFTVDKQDELKKQARNEAIEKAKTKAKELANQLGIKLVRVSNFSEGGVVPYYYLEKAVPAGMGGGETPQIETGENKIEVQVTITYEIK